MALPFLTRFPVLVAASLLSLTSAAISQTNAAYVAPNSMAMLDLHARAMRVNVNLVLVPVSVTDSMHRPITDLKQQNFELYEGADQQQIRYFYQEDSPISVALVLDVSGSMGKRINVLREAVGEFFANANPNDDYTVVTVS